MAALGTPVSERSRKAFGRVLQAMQDSGTARNVAHAMGVSEATVSRVKTEKLEDAIALLYQLGFKVVSQDKHCVPVDYLQALEVMAREHILRAKPALDWEDE